MRNSSSIQDETDVWTTGQMNTAMMRRRLAYEELSWTLGRQGYFEVACYLGAQARGSSTQLDCICERTRRPCRGHRKPRGLRAAQVRFQRYLSTDDDRIPCLRAEYTHFSHS